MGDSLNRHDELVHTDRDDRQQDGGQRRDAQHEAKPLKIAQLMTPALSSGRSSVRNAVAAKTRNKVFEGDSPLA